jgi:uncharacterized protein YaiL (DUF2058 family)
LSTGALLLLLLLLLQGHEQRLLKDLALSREQLKRDLAASKQELELVAGAAEAAKEEAAAQVNLLTQQLATAQQRLAEAEKVPGGLGLVQFVGLLSGR